MSVGTEPFLRANIRSRMNSLGKNNRTSSLLCLFSSHAPSSTIFSPRNSLLPVTSSGGVGLGGGTTGIGGGGVRDGVEQAEAELGPGSDRAELGAAWAG